MNTVGGHGLPSIPSLNCCPACVSGGKCLLLTSICLGEQNVLLAKTVGRQDPHPRPDECGGRLQDGDHAEEINQHLVYYIL